MLVLASQSPRRSELLRNAGFAFETRPVNADETPIPGEPPDAMVLRLARLKAHTCAVALGPVPAQTYVLGADTTVVCDGNILNKPVDAADAERMLRLLSGRWHQVKTGVCIVTLLPGESAAAGEWTETVTTEVHFAALSAGAIAAYGASPEPRDKAGAYAIQGMASRWVTAINGCYFNVVGLPISAVARLLALAEAAETLVLG